MRIVIILVFLNTQLIAQNWEIIATFNNGGVNCLYNDTVTNKLIIGGQFRLANGDSMASVAQYDGEILQSMGCGIDWDCIEPYITNLGYKVLAVERYNEKLFAVGQISEINGFSSVGITFWDGAGWNAVSNGLTYTSGGSGIGRGLSILENNIVVLGSFNFCSGVAANAACSYSESDGFESLGFPNYETAQRLSCAAQFQGVNYFAGRFNNATTPTNGDIWNIVKHENGQWLPVGNGIRGGMSSVSKMLVFQDKLYVAGVMSKAAGAPGNAIAAWDGQQWDDVGGGLFAPVEAHVYDMKVHQGKLYVVGTFTYAGGVPVEEFAVWDGVNWCRIETDVQEHLTVIRAVDFYKDTLYLAGAHYDFANNVVTNKLLKRVQPLESFQCGNLTGLSSVTENQFNAYPNPTTGLINLSFGKSVKGNITITNLMGQRLVTQSVMGESSTLDLGSFSAGIYFLQFTDTNGSVSTQKILLE